MSLSAHKLSILKAKTNASCNDKHIKTRQMYQCRNGVQTGEKWESDKKRNKTQQMMQVLAFL
jgi:hypothetical protein